jgi:hypothetical protein
MAAMASRAIPLTPEIAIEDLVPGDHYRIEHRHGYWPPKTGTFSGIRTIDPKCAYFLRLAEPPRHHPKDRFFCTDEWTFHNSGKSIVLERLSKSKSLPHNLKKYLERFGGSKRMKKTKRTRRTRRTRRR